MRQHNIWRGMPDCSPAYLSK